MVSVAQEGENMKNFGIILCVCIGTTSSGFAADFQELFLSKMSGKSLQCAFKGKLSGVLTVSKKAEVTKNDFCWGGEELSIGRQGNWIVTTCGDDGYQTLIVMADLKKLLSKDAACPVKSGAIDWTDTGTMIEAITFANIGPAYPYEDGTAQYLTCCLQ